MIWKIVQMSGQEIPVGSEEEVMKILEMANKGVKLVMTRYGVVNCASIDSIVPHKEKMQDAFEQLKFDRQLTLKVAEAKAIGPSPFTRDLQVKMKMLGAQMEMLGPGERTAAQEEGGRR